MRKYLLVLILVAGLSFFLNYSESPKEQIIIAVDNDGTAKVIHKIDADPFLSNILVRPISDNISKILALDENNIFLKTRAGEDQLRIDTLGASQVTLSYDADLVTKSGSLWKLVYSADVESTVVLPPSSKIIGLNKIPLDIANDDYVMPAGDVSMSFTIEPLRAYEFSVDEGGSSYRVSVVTAAGITNLIYNNNLQFDVDDNVPLLVIVPQSLFSNIKQVMFNNDKVLFDQFNQNATHYWLRMEAPTTGTFLIIPSVKSAPPICGPGTIEVENLCIPEEKPRLQKNGGCLIATATYGSELAPQVQALREIKQEKVLQTKSGAAFMDAFNLVYYSFSPTIADWERQNPAFREATKITITPMITSLSILNYADTDEKILVFGVGVILLNIVMYLVIPAFLVIRLQRYLAR
ncbi:MAG: CFI-box-CTERM domain-containing protein [Candidatus Nitrosotenuis sp.]